MKKVIFFILLFLTVLFFFAGLFFFYEARFFSSRASVSRTAFSVDNSYVFVTPLKASSSTQEKIRITVFVLDDQGMGVGQKTVTLSQNSSLQLESYQVSTDTLGRAVFDVSSGKAGEYYLDVSIDQIKLPQKAHLLFY